jgi:hypothetical protein
MQLFYSPFFSSGILCISGGTSLELYYPKPPFETTNKGPISGVMHDQRPAEEVGKESAKQKMITHFNDSKVAAAYQSLYGKSVR